MDVEEIKQKKSSNIGMDEALVLYLFLFRFKFIFRD